VGKVHSPLRPSSDLCSHVIHAAQHPIDLDDRQANAVAARIELDLRIGAAFTRLQTLQLQNLGEALHDRILSYGIMTHQFNPRERLLS
jgi:DNA topoisomerase IA